MRERSGIEKAAILIIALGPKAAGAVYRHLNEKEIEDVSTAIARLGVISEEEKQKVLEEFLRMSTSQEKISHGGLDLAREILDNALGRYRASAIISRLQGLGEATSFELLRKIDPETIANFLKKEHPQTIAAVLSHMDTRLMGTVLAKLPTELQPEVSYRIAVMDRPNPDTIKSVEEVLNSYFSGEFSEVSRHCGGTKKVAEALNEIDPDVWREILDGIEEYSKEIANEVKNLMFIFEDIVLLDDRSVQEILKNIESRDLAMALKASSESVKEKIFGNMSKRAALGLREDIEYMGPVRLADVEGAQQRIVEVVRKLEEEGIILVGRTGPGSMMVD